MTTERKIDLLFVALAILLSVGGVCLVFDRPELCAALMAGVLVVALSRWHRRLDLLVAASGLLLGPTLELFATNAGLWRYPHTTFGKLPLWVFTLWPAFPVVLVRLTHALRPTDRPTEQPTTDLLVGGGIVALEIPVLVLFGNERPWLATVVTAAMLIGAAWLRRSPQTWLMLFLSGVFGTLCELLPIHVQAWIYPSPVVLGMPPWLPTGYSLFGFALVRFAIGLDGAIEAGSRAGLAKKVGSQP